VNKIKEKKQGITLIALIVTVVVLIILLGIVIGNISGEHGVITKALQSVEEDRFATVEEARILWDVKKEIHKGNEKEKLLEVLQPLGPNGSNTLEEQEIEEILKTGKIEIAEKEIVFFIPNIEEIKIGDYVNYTYDTVDQAYSLTSTESGYSSDQAITQTANLKWRVLNIDPINKKVDLISETVTDDTINLDGYDGYNHGVTILNDICKKQYSNSNLNVTARNIKIEDIEAHFSSEARTIKNEGINRKYIWKVFFS